MATATQTDDEMIILEDDVNMEALTEEVIDFAEPEVATDMVAEPEATPKRKLSLGALMGKKEAPVEVAEALVEQESQDIVNLGESLEATSDASDLFAEPEVDSEVSLLEESDSNEEVLDLFAEETSEESAVTEESLLEVQDSGTDDSVAMFGESEVEQELNLASEEVDEVSTEETSLLETGKESMLKEADSVETEMDLFTETEVSPEANSEALLLEESIEPEVSDEVSLLGDLTMEEAVSEPEASLIEDESDIFGWASTGDDSQIGDDSAASDDQSMDEILSATIAKLEVRKALIIADKTVDKEKIKELKSQIKEIEHDVADIQESITEMWNEQRKITNNVKTLEAMKLKA